MTNKKYLQDLSEIKNIMNKSTRFMSLSGLSGILAGIYALIGAFMAHLVLKEYVNTNNRAVYNEELNFALGFVTLELLIIAIVVAILSVITAYILTKRKAKKEGQTIWNSTTKRLLFHFFIPLATGGIFSLSLLNQGFYGFVAPATLIFYGLAIFNASNYTVSNVKYLGLAEIILGLIALNFIGYGLYFWAVGFGVFHIIYGTMIYINGKKQE